MSLVKLTCSVTWSLIFTQETFVKVVKTEPKGLVNSL